MKNEEQRFKEEVLRSVPSRKLKEKMMDQIPPEERFALPDNWLHLEMLERFQILQFAEIFPGMNILEIGCGAHAMATVPLAYRVGSTGRIVAIDRERWKFFEEITIAAGMEKRVIPLKCDAQKAPFPFENFDLAVILHGIRSLMTEEIIIQIFKEMRRVAKRVFVCHSLPEAKNAAQKAYLQMYNLHEPILEAISGEKDDLHYFSQNKLISLVEAAEGTVVKKGVYEPRLPHFLAYIPKDLVRKIKDERQRAELSKRWDKAFSQLKKHGTEHPPVSWILFK